MGEGQIQYIQPQPGPQQRFCASDADILIFGGEAGGGKTWILTYEAGKWTHLPGYGGIIFRRDSTQLVGPGSCWEKARMLYPAMGARMVESPNMVAKWEDDSGESFAEVHFRHCQHEWTVEDHDGKEYAFVGIDEGQYWSAYMLWYLWGRCRTMCGVKPYMRITCNPDPDCYLRTLLDWWIDPKTGYPIPERDGVVRWAVRQGDDLKWFDDRESAQSYCRELLEAADDPEIARELEHLKPISISFIRSRLKDNPALLAEDPDYGARLAMQDADSRAKKLGGNWNSRPKAGEMFDRAWVDYLEEPPNPRDVAFSVRAWDKAGSQPSELNPDPDWTRGVRMDLLKNGNIVISDVASCRLPPGGVDSLNVATAKMDGPDVEQAYWQDPGQAGLVDEEHVREILGAEHVKSHVGNVTFVKEVKNKVEYFKPFSAFADPKTKLGKVLLVRRPWNAAYLGELEKFPPPPGKDGKGVKKDQCDATSRGYLAITSRKGSTAKRLLNAMQRIETPKADFMGRFRLR